MWPKFSFFHLSRPGKYFCIYSCILPSSTCHMHLLAIIVFDFVRNKFACFSHVCMIFSGGLCGTFIALKMNILITVDNLGLCVIFLLRQSMLTIRRYSNKWWTMLMELLIDLKHVHGASTFPFLGLQTKFECWWCEPCVAPVLQINVLICTIGFTDCIWWLNWIEWLNCFDAFEGFPKWLRLDLEDHVVNMDYDAHEFKNWIKLNIQTSNDCNLLP